MRVTKWLFWGGILGMPGDAHHIPKMSNLKPHTADDQLSEIASSIPPGDPSCVELKHSAFLAPLLLEEVDLESTSETASPVGKPVLQMQHTCSSEPVAQSPDAPARPASNNMPLSEHDTQELGRLLYPRAGGSNGFHTT